MEIGHNILHGQWDWMRDPKIHSTTWEWDSATPAEQWKHSHNELHHTYTNVIGKDNDLGYGIMRVDEDQPWHPFYLAQPVWNFVNMLFFEYGIAAYDLELGADDQEEADQGPGVPERLKQVLHKIKKQAAKDYLVHPALSIPTGSFLTRWPPTSPPTRSATSGATRSSSAGTSPRVSRPSRSARSTGRPAATGTSARCSARPTSPAPRRCT